MKKEDLMLVHEFKRFKEFRVEKLLEYAGRKIGPEYIKYLPDYDQPSELSKQYLVNMLNVIPDRVKKETNDYMAPNDNVFGWIGDNYIKDDTCFTTCNEIWKKFISSAEFYEMTARWRPTHPLGAIPLHCARESTHELLSSSFYFQ